MFVKLDKLCVYGFDLFFRKYDACTGHTRTHPVHSGRVWTGYYFHTTPQWIRSGRVRTGYYFHTTPQHPIRVRRVWKAQVNWIFKQPPARKRRRRSPENFPWVRASGGASKRRSWGLYVAGRGSD